MHNNNDDTLRNAPRNPRQNIGMQRQHFENENEILNARDAEEMQNQNFTLQHFPPMRHFYFAGGHASGASNDYNLYVELSGKAAEREYYAELDRKQAEREAKKIEFKSAKRIVTNKNKRAFRMVPALNRPADGSPSYQKEKINLLEKIINKGYAIAPRSELDLKDLTMNNTWHKSFIDDKGNRVIEKEELLRINRRAITEQHIVDTINNKGFSGSFTTDKGGRMVAERHGSPTGIRKIIESKQNFTQKLENEPSFRPEAEVLNRKVELEQNLTEESRQEGQTKIRKPYLIRL